MNRHDAALFAELGITGIRSLGDEAWGIRRALAFGKDGVCGVYDAFDALEEQLAHAVTSLRKVASRAVAQGLRRSFTGAEMKGSRSTEISRRLPPRVPDPGDEKAVVCRQLLNEEDVTGRGSKKHGGGRLGKEPKERMDHERLILIDLGADAFAEGGLHNGDGDSTVGDVASRMNELVLGQFLKQFVQTRLSFQVEFRWIAPKGAEKHLGKFRAAERSQLL